MLLMFYVLPLVWLAVFGVCVAGLVRLTPQRGPVALSLASIGWQVVWAVPVLLLQFLLAAVVRQIGASRFSSFWDALVVLYWPLPVHVGGMSIRLVFEESVLVVSGHRESTLMDNLPYFFLVLLIQMAALAGLFYWRYRHVGTLHDRVILAIGIFVLTNGLLNITWPWWGT